MLRGGAPKAGRTGAGGGKNVSAKPLLSFRLLAASLLAASTARRLLFRSLSRSFSTSSAVGSGLPYAFRHALMTFSIDDGSVSRW